MKIGFFIAACFAALSIYMELYGRNSKFWFGCVLVSWMVMIGFLMFGC